MRGTSNFVLCGFTRRSNVRNSRLYERDSDALYLRAVDGAEVGSVFRGAYARSRHEPTEFLDRREKLDPFKLHEDKEMIMDFGKLASGKDTKKQPNEKPSQALAHALFRRLVEMDESAYAHSRREPTEFLDRREKIDSFKLHEDKEMITDFGKLASGKDTKKQPNEKPSQALEHALFRRLMEMDESAYAHSRREPTGFLVRREEDGPAKSDVEAVEAMSKPSSG
ncbi:uncharacterized protein FIBRA_06032 [Fibroporia radiculosa]|uniref:Uncharacterized protein n=1 Tax=Fibroporia radiculosa TaxID=599839 RepID=J4IB17_9APHY|nr:uncharacterized protein FIBRA_06032 [Fibroporia radiculosa]CCM03881.1 predicted protein [Fibroporia radiculosa]